MTCLFDTPAAAVPVYEQQRALLAFGYAFAGLARMCDLAMPPAPLPLLAALRVEASNVPFRLPPPPYDLDESLKTRFFVIHGTSNPQHGPGLERFWLGPKLTVTTSLTYKYGAGMPVPQRQRALTVFGCAFAAQTHFAATLPPLSLRRHRRVCVWPPSPLEKREERLIRMCVVSADGNFISDGRLDSKIIQLAILDRAHLVYSTPRSLAALKRGRTALAEACAANAMHMVAEEGDD
ncbi:hypothetical protein C8R47DRAFT_1221030 [Mycena vitilis]|nr:hypothetical protein C8R47DRAFT_1221030 [Mycena vitilis]